MALTIVRGPVAGGKSQYIAGELAPGELFADVTRFWAAVGGYERDANGKYPTRRADDPALGAARRLKALAVKIAADEGIGGFVTTSDSSAEAVQRLVDQGATAGVVTIDPGKATVLSRLGLVDDLDDDDDDDEPRQCKRAVRRWYGPRSRSRRR